MMYMKRAGLGLNPVHNTLAGFTQIVHFLVELFVVMNFAGVL